MLNKKNISTILFSVWMLFSLVFIASKGVKTGWNNKNTDFNNYYMSAKLLVSGKKIHQFYDNNWFASQSKSHGIPEGAKFAPFTPVTALLYLPLTYWDLITAKRIWLIINVIILLLLPFRLKHYFNLSIFKSLLILSVFFVPISSNLNFGQVYLVLSFALIELVGTSIVKSKVKIASVLIAFFTLIKYLPILYLMYLFKNKAKFKIAVFIFLISILCFVGFIYIIDSTAYTTYFNVFTNHLQGDLSGQGKYAVGFQSLDALLNNLFVFNAIENPSPFINLPILKPVLKFSIFGIIASLSFFIFKSDKYQFTFVNSSLFIFGAFVLFPASASYHFLFLILPSVFIYQWLVLNHNPLKVILFFVLLSFSFIIQQHHIPNFSNWPTVNLVLHFPRLWNLILLFSFLSIVKLRSKLN